MKEARRQTGRGGKQGRKSGKSARPANKAAAGKRARSVKGTAAGSAKKQGFKRATGTGSASARNADRQHAHKREPVEEAPQVAAVSEEMRKASTSVQLLTVSPDDAGMRLDRWFKAYFPALPLSHLNKIVRKGEVRVDGKRADTSSRLEGGAQVRVPPLHLDAVAAPRVRRARESEEDARFLQSLMLYEDRHLFIINKPFGLAVQGGPGVKRHVDGMLEAMAPPGGQVPRLVHRLDRDTSGVLLVARTRKMAADLGEIFRARETRKIYWAVVHGVPKPAQGRISAFLKKGPGMTGERSSASSRRFASSAPRSMPREDRERVHIARHGEENAQHSLTYYTTVDKVAPRVAWLSMRPITGRTHQLRAHCEAIGNPIIGDPKYSFDVAENDPRRTDPLRALPSGIENKLHLVARRLVLPHPKGGMIDVTAPLPDHMQQTFDLFGFDATRHDPIEDAPEK